MGFFNRNNNKQEASAGPPVTFRPPATLQRPTSPDRQSGTESSIYSEATKSQKSTEPYHPEEDVIHEDDEEIDDEEDVHKATEWDEGGSSHCGYHESIHDTLMKIGGSVHGVVGDPPAGMEKKMNTVANWFQEMSYAIRDFWRGQSNMSEDLQDVMKSVMEQGSHDEHDEHADQAQQTSTTEDAKVATSTAVVA